MPGPRYGGRARARPQPSDSRRRRWEDARSRDTSSTQARYRSAATWTVVHSGRPVSWASRSRWSSQPRPLRGMDPASVPPPFRGVTMQDRHPADPLLPYTEEERRALCPSCGVPIIHRSAHLRGPLHQARAEQARSSRATESDVAAALALIRRLRPELLPSAEPSPQGPPSSNQDLMEFLEDLPEN